MDVNIGSALTDAGGWVFDEGLGLCQRQGHVSQHRSIPRMCVDGPRRMGTGVDRYGVAEITRSPLHAWKGGDRLAPVSPLCTSRERRPKPDVRNLTVGAGACAFTGEPAGHARMPPGLQNLVTEFLRVWGSYAPPSGFHGRQASCGVRSGLSQAQY